MRLYPQNYVSPNGTTFAYDEARHLIGEYVAQGRDGPPQVGYAKHVLPKQCATDGIEHVCGRRHASGPAV